MFLISVILALANADSSCKECKPFNKSVAGINQKIATVKKDRPRILKRIVRGSRCG